MDLKKILPLIGIALFIFILIKLDIRNVIVEICNLRINYFMIALLFVIISINTATFKWFIIAKKQGIKIKYWDAFKINIICDFYGFVTPSKLGTIIRAEYLKKHSDIGSGISNFVTDKVLDFYSLFFLALLFGFVFKEKLGINFLAYLSILIMFLVFILFSLLIFDKNKNKKFLKAVYKKLLPNKFKAKAKLAYNSFYENVPEKKLFFLFFIVHLINWGFIYSVDYFIGKSLGINISFVYFLAIFPIGTLIAMIPISINGLGTREAVLISLFAIFGISSAKVFSMSIITIFITGIIPALIANFLIWGDKEL
ncbi:MAG: lysylphosphatidylglycerol synthase transmembrane domain-containing protein [Nanoarchaeota archaeon]